MTGRSTNVGDSGAHTESAPSDPSVAAVAGSQPASRAEGVPLAPSALIQPETANDIDREDEGSFETGDLASGKRPEGDPVEPEAGAVSDAGAGESPAANFKDASGKPGSATADPAPSNIIKLGSGKPLRPYCLAVAAGSVCAGQGPKHCFTCEQAHQAGGMVLVPHAGSIGA